MAAAADPVPAEPAGTTWRWVHFASSAEDFAVAEPERYTLAFTAVGWIRLRADCNHGAGGAVFPKPGVIRIEGVALTRAMCPSGSLGDRFARGTWREPSVGRSVNVSFTSNCQQTPVPCGSLDSADNVMPREA